MDRTTLGNGLHPGNWFSTQYWDLRSRHPVYCVVQFPRTSLSPAIKLCQSFGFTQNRFLSNKMVQLRLYLAWRTLITVQRRIWNEKIRWLLYEELQSVCSEVHFHVSYFWSRVRYRIILVVFQVGTAGQVWATVGAVLSCWLRGWAGRSAVRRRMVWAWPGARRIWSLGPCSSGEFWVEVWSASPARVRDQSVHLSLLSSNCPFMRTVSCFGFYFLLITDLECRVWPICPAWNLEPTHKPTLQTQTPRA